MSFTIISRVFELGIGRRIAPEIKSRIQRAIATKCFDPPRNTWFWFENSGTWKNAIVLPRSFVVEVYKHRQGNPDIARMITAMTLNSHAFDSTIIAHLSWLKEDMLRRKDEVLRAVQSYHLAMRWRWSANRGLPLHMSDSRASYDSMNEKLRDALTRCGQIIRTLEHERFHVESSALMHAVTVSRPKANKVSLPLTRRESRRFLYYSQNPMPSYGETSETLSCDQKIMIHS